MTVEIYYFSVCENKQFHGQCFYRLGAHLSRKRHCKAHLSSHFCFAAQQIVLPQVAQTTYVDLSGFDACVGHLVTSAYALACAYDHLVSLRDAFLVVAAQVRLFHFI